MIEPREKKFTLPDGTEKAYQVSKFDAISGREIVSQYPISGLPKLGDYKTNEEIMFKLMCFVAVDLGNGNIQPLSTPELIRNHVPDWETLAKIEWAVMEYNCSFFAEGKVSSFLEDLIAKLPTLISSMLTPSLEQLSQKDSQPSKS